MIAWFKSLFKGINISWSWRFGYGKLYKEKNQRFNKALGDSTDQAIAKYRKIKG